MTQDQELLEAARQGHVRIVGGTLHHHPPDRATRYANTHRAYDSFFSLWTSGLVELRECRDGIFDVEAVRELPE